MITLMLDEIQNALERLAKILPRAIRQIKKSHSRDFLCFFGAVEKQVTNQIVLL